MRGRPKKPPAPPAVIDMTKVIAAASKPKPCFGKAPVLDMANVELAVRRLGKPLSLPAPRVSHAGIPAEDTARRGYLTRALIPVRACCGFHHADFNNGY